MNCHFGQREGTSGIFLNLYQSVLLWPAPSAETWASAMPLQPEDVLKQ